jgi:hypothetical protein
MLATGAMLVRNSLILAILAFQAFAYSLIPLLIMLAASLALGTGPCMAVERLNELPLRHFDASIKHR